jgi:hypothetical protein
MGIEPMPGSWDTSEHFRREQDREGKNKMRRAHDVFLIRHV